MASIQQLATMENLPSDVISDVFIRSLAKQLAQMRCVCKSWNALLSQSSFIKSHLRRSIHTNDQVLLFFYQGIQHFYSGPLSAHLSISPHIELTNFIKLPVNLQSDGAIVIGSVNGLICLYYGSHNSYVVHIWNPYLSAVSTLPPYILPSRGKDPIRIFFGFGFDPKTDDYKVVKLASFLKPPGFVDPMAPVVIGTIFWVVKERMQVEVYSMRKGSWHIISQRFPSPVTGFSRPDEVCLDGHDGYLHWLCFVDEGMAQTIVAFDLRVEIFCEIHVPEFVSDFNLCKCFYALGVLGGKLCVMSCVENGECEVWVMDEYGVSESWVKNYVFPQFSDNIDPYGFTLHTEFLFEAYENRLALYDPNEANVKIFRITGRFVGVAKIVDYVDSLV